MKSGELVNSNEVLSGDTFEVHAGEIIPLDGEILNGNTIVDESIVTGESTPTPKEARRSSSFWKYKPIKYSKNKYKQN